MTVSGSESNSSGSSRLTPEQQELLSKLLDEYFTSLEQGRPLTRQELEARCPSLAPFVGEYLASLEFLQGAAVGFRPALTADVRGASDSMVARQLGDYRIVREIGRGGMGVVYEAWQESLQRRVALKVLPFAALLDAQQIARFRNEAQAAAQLHHPHIVPVFAVGVEQGVHYYAMQYIDGQPLDRLIATRRRPGSSSSSTNEVAGQPPLPLNLAGRAVDDLEYIRAVADLTIQAAEVLRSGARSGGRSSRHQAVQPAAHRRRPIVGDRLRARALPRRRRTHASRRLRGNHPLHESRAGAGRRT